MKYQFALPIVLALLAAAPLRADETPRARKTISAALAKRISDMTYAELLRQAASRGWTYPSAQIESGYRRHLEEFKAQLANHGYRVVEESPET